MRSDSQSSVSSVSPNTFGGGWYCYYRPANSTRLRYTTTRCRKSNSTKYKAFKFKPNQVGVITMLILKVLLLTIIMKRELNLRTKFDLDVIIFRTIKHPLPYYDYVSSIFDARFGNKSILKEDLVDEGSRIWKREIGIVRRRER